GDKKTQATTVCLSSPLPLSLSPPLFFSPSPRSIFPIKDPQQIRVVIGPDAHVRAAAQLAPRRAHMFEQRKIDGGLAMYAAGGIGEGREDAERFLFRGPALFGLPVRPAPFVD